MIKKDSLLMLSTEQYSDQQHAGPFKALQDFDLIAIAKVVQNLPPRCGWNNKNGPYDVIEYLKEEGFIEAIDCLSFHLGCHGTIEVTAW